MSSSSQALRWRDDLPESWDDVGPYPPIPAERDVDADPLELVDDVSGALLQENERGRFVWAENEALLLDLEDVV